MNADKFRKKLGARLFALAVEWSQEEDLPGTVKEREARIKRMGSNRRKIIDGSRSVRSARLAVEEAAKNIRQARLERKFRRAARALGYCPVDFVVVEPGGFWCGKTKWGAEWRQPKRGKSNRAAILGSDQPAILRSSQTFEERLRARTHGYISRALKNNYRMNEEGTIETVLTEPENGADIEQRESEDWDYYSRSCRYPKLVTDTIVTVPSDWLLLYKKGFSVVDGKLTLAAQQMECNSHGVDLYSIAWLEQGRGYALRVEHGFLALGFNTTHRAPTREKALLGLLRKAEDQRAAEAQKSAASAPLIEEVVPAAPRKERPRAAAGVAFLRSQSFMPARLPNGTMSFKRSGSPVVIVTGVEKSVALARRFRIAVYDQEPGPDVTPRRVEEVEDLEKAIRGVLQP